MTSDWCVMCKFNEAMDLDSLKTLDTFQRCSNLKYKVALFTNTKICIKYWHIILYLEYHSTLYMSYVLCKRVAETRVREYEHLPRKYIYCIKLKLKKYFLKILWDIYWQKQNHRAGGFDGGLSPEAFSTSGVLLDDFKFNQRVGLEWMYYAKE